MFNLFASKNATIRIIAAFSLFYMGVLHAEGVLTMENAVSEALDANPSLASINARAMALADIPQQQGTLPEPKLALNALNLPVDTFSLSQEPMTQIQVGIKQVLPHPGKLALQQQAAEFAANAATKEVDELRLRLVKDVKTVWWNIFYLDRAMNTVKRNESLLRQINTVAETKYQVGQGLQQDILLAQLELSKIQLESVRLQGIRRKEEARLNALLGRTLESVLVLPEPQSESLPSLVKSVEQMQQLAFEIRPSLNAFQNQIEGAKARVDLAKKDYYPDYTLAALYGFRSGNNIDGSSRTDFASFLLSINLPIFTGSRQKKAVDQRTNEWLQKKYALDDGRLQVAAEISASVAAYQQAAEQVQLFQNNVIPQAQQTVDSMLVAYQVNKVDFLSVIRSQTALYEYQNQYWRAFSIANQALAALVASVGKEIT